MREENSMELIVLPQKKPRSRPNARSSRKNRYRHAAHSQKHKHGKAMRAFFALVVFLVCGLYITTAHTAGEWLSEHFVVPLFFRSLNEVEADTVAEGDIVGDADLAVSVENENATEAIASPSPTMTNRSQSEATVTEQVSLPGVTFYSVQLGVFSTEEGARSVADEFREKGAAGYVLLEDKYHVLASAYSSRDEASGVAKRLEQSGLDTYVFSTGAEEINMMITAKQSQVETFKSACDGFYEAIGELGSLTFALDQNTMSEDELLRKLSSIESDLVERKAALDSSGKAAAGTPLLVIEGLSSLYDTFIDALHKMTEQNDDAPLLISTNIKYNHIDIMWRYIEYLRRLRA